ncbi:MAG: glutaredoxin domain-containing protein [Candidatus Woesearchaeota archaeon]
MEVKIYSTPTCTWCQKAKEWFKKNKVSFQDMDITESDTYRDELIEKSHQMAVPVIDIDGKIFVGFQEKVMEGIFPKEEKKGKKK